MHVQTTAHPLYRHGRYSRHAMALALLGMLQACTTAPPAPSPVAPSDRPGTAPSSPAVVSPPESSARDARAYRQDAARHLYQHNASRIYRGRLPPLLYAVGVLDVDIDRSGQVQQIHWRRAPRHAPEVMAGIERMVRAAAPYPAPSHLQQVTYTDVWLWHKSGLFQLDTLTEGQD